MAKSRRQSFGQWGGGGSLDAHAHIQLIATQMNMLYPADNVALVKGSVHIQYM